FWRIDDYVGYVAALVGRLIPRRAALMVGHAVHRHCTTRTRLGAECRGGQHGPDHHPGCDSSRRIIAAAPIAAMIVIVTVLLPVFTGLMPITLPVFLPFPGSLLPALLLFPAMLLPVFAVSGVARLLPGLHPLGCCLAARLTGCAPLKAAA